MSNDSAEGGVAIIGGGAIGGFVAGALATAGHAVTLCVRTPFDRLVIEKGGEVREVPVRITSDPSGLAPVRWLLMTTKAQEVAGTVPWLRALAGPGTTTVVIQNGVRQDERVRPFVAAGAVMPAVIYSANERVGPGHVRHHNSARMIVPETPDGAAFRELFANADFEIVLTDDFVTASWRKLLGNVVANPITALTVRRMDVFGDEPMRELARGMLHEAVAVARADGARLDTADADTIVDNYGRWGSASGTSMYYDRLAGRPLEHAYITGAVVDGGARHGIDVPLNRAVLTLLGAVSGRPLGPPD